MNEIKETGKMEELKQKIILEGIPLSRLIYPGHFKKSATKDIPSLGEDIFDFFSLKIREGLENNDLQSHLFGFGAGSFRMRETASKLLWLEKARDYIRRTDPEMRTVILTKKEGDINLLGYAIKLFERNIFTSLREWVPFIEEYLGFKKHPEGIEMKKSIEECSFEETQRWVGPHSNFSLEFNSRDEKTAYHNLINGWTGAGRFLDDFDIRRHYSTCDRDVAEHCVEIENGKIFYFRKEWVDLRSLECILAAIG